MISLGQSCASIPTLFRHLGHPSRVLQTASDASAGHAFWGTPTKVAAFEGSFGSHNWDALVLVLTRPSLTIKPSYSSRVASLYATLS
jgi:hypothetical protein